MEMMRSNRVLWGILFLSSLVTNVSCVESEKAMNPTVTRKSARILFRDDFEAGTGEKPESWKSDAWIQDGRTVFSREEKGGTDGGRCLKIQTKERENDARWVRSVELAPHTAYILRGRIRTEAVKWAQEGKIGANICVMGIGGCQSDQAERSGSYDWTAHRVDFATGDSGRVEIACRLGFTSSAVTGSAWFDDIAVEENPDVVRREGKHVYLNLYREDLEGIREANFKRWVKHLDATYEAIADLTGARPWNGEKIGIYSCQWYPGGWAVAGNPILWMRQFVRERMDVAEREDDWVSGILHELSHDFDEESWNFNGEFFANLKYYYALETLNGRVNGYQGKGYLKYWKSDADGSYEKAWRNPDPAKRKAHHDGLQYKWLEIRERVGWEPFKKTFRYFRSAPADRIPRDGWGKLELFHAKLTEYSGFDAWSVFTEEDRALLRSEYH